MTNQPPIISASPPMPPVNSGAPGAPQITPPTGPRPAGAPPPFFALPHKPVPFGLVLGGLGVAASAVGLAGWAAMGGPIGAVAALGAAGATVGGVRALRRRPKRETKGTGTGRGAVRRRLPFGRRPSGSIPRPTLRGLLPGGRSHGVSSPRRGIGGLPSSGRSAGSRLFRHRPTSSARGPGAPGRLSRVFRPAHSAGPAPRGARGFRTRGTGGAGNPGRPVLRHRVPWRKTSDPRVPGQGGPIRSRAAGKPRSWRSLLSRTSQHPVGPAPTGAKSSTATNVRTPVRPGRGRRTWKSLVGWAFVPDDELFAPLPGVKPEPASGPAQPELGAVAQPPRQGTPGTVIKGPDGKLSGYGEAATRARPAMAIRPPVRRGADEPTTVHAAQQAWSDRMSAHEQGAPTMTRSRGDGMTAAWPAALAAAEAAVAAAQHAVSRLAGFPVHPDAVQKVEEIGGHLGRAFAGISEANAATRVGDDAEWRVAERRRRPGDHQWVQ